MKNPIRTLSVTAIAIIAFSACTTNNFALKLAYNQLDFVLQKELMAFADFNSQQEALIEAAVKDSLTWHRREELPRIKFSIQQLDTMLQQKEFKESDVLWLDQQIRLIAQRFEDHSPILALAQMIKGLSATQLQQIKNHLDEKLELLAEEVLELEGEDQSERAVEELDKFLRRIGLSLNNNQLNIARTSFTQRTLNRHDFHQLDIQWHSDLKEMLDQTKEDHFVTSFRKIHLQRHKQAETIYPDRYAHDQKVYQSLLLKLLRSLSVEQKDSMSSQLGQYIILAEELSGQT